MTASLGQNDTFIDLLRAGCDDRNMNGTLERLLSLPDRRRKVFLEHLVGQLRDTGAPEDFIHAMACLADDRVAEKAYEVIYQCEHPRHLRGPALWLQRAALVGLLALLAWLLLAF